MTQVFQSFPRLTRWRNEFIAIGVVALLAVMAVAITWPLARGISLSTHDGEFHLWRMFELQSAVKAGIVYPRWAPDLVLGYGYPVFNYYPSLDAYLGVIGSLLGLRDLVAFDAVYIVSLLVAGVGMFALMRGHVGNVGAFVGAIAYAFSPYALANIFVRGAHAEFLAMAVLPAVLWSFGRLAERPTLRRILVAGVAFGVPILTHNLSALLMVPPVVLYYLVAMHEQVGWRWSVKHLLSFVMACGLAVSLTAFFWLPAIWESNLAHIQSLTNDALDIADNFRDLSSLFQTTLGYSYVHPVQIGLVQGLVALIGFLRAVWTPRFRRWGLFFALLAVVSILLQQSGSLPLWELAPYGRYFQFPWRMMMLTSLGLAWLTAWVVAPLSARNWRSSLMAMCNKGRMVLALGLVAMMVILFRYPFTPATGVPGVEAPSVPALLHHELNSQQVGAVTRGEYIPSSVESDPLAYVATALPVVSAESSSNVQLRLEEVSSWRLSGSVIAQHPTRLTFDRFYYPGWHLTIDESEVPVAPSGELGLISAEVPAGTHRLTLDFGDTPVRIIGWLWSGLALCGTIVFPVVLYFWRRRSQPVPRRGVAYLLVCGFLVLLLLAVSVWPAGSSLVSAERTTVPVKFGDVAELSGVVVGDSSATQAEVLGVTLYWHALKAPGRQYQVRLRLVDDNGETVGQRLKRPLFAVRPTTLWATDMVIHDYQEVSLWPGIAGGTYTLKLALVDEQTGQAVTLSEDGQGISSDPGQGETVLGKVTLSASQTAILPAPEHQLGSNFGGKLLLRGFSMSGVETKNGANSAYLTSTNPGDKVTFTTYWEGLDDVDRDYWFSVQLLDSAGQKVSQTEMQPTDGKRPTTLWRRGEAYADSLELAIPADAKPGKYKVTVSLYSRPDMLRLPLSDGSGDTVTLGFVKVLSAPASSYEPLSGGALTFSSLARLEGLKTDRATPGVWRVQLLWSGLSRSDKDYTVFVHLLDADGHVVAQQDSQPSGGAYPTSFWDEGDKVEDVHELPLSAELSSGTYRIEVGFYLLSTGERLRLPDGTDSALIGSFVVASK